MTSRTQGFDVIRCVDGSTVDSGRKGDVLYLPSTTLGTDVVADFAKIRVLKALFVLKRASVKIVQRRRQHKRRNDGVRSEVKVHR